MTRTCTPLNMTKTYEVIKENKIGYAAACAVERGGYEINDASEQSEIFSQLSSSAGITCNTTAPDWRWWCLCMDWR